jgi:uncharacterized protein YfaS (alpha-2-macroglobulin family)
MKTSKELIMASILAIGLSAGLVALSNGFFSEPMPAAKLTLLDAFSSKGGVGINKTAGDFEPLDNVSIYAYLTQGGNALQNHTVTFYVQTPANTQTIITAMTNEFGLAEADISLLPTEGHIIGTWYIETNTTVNNQNLTDTLNFQCQAQQPKIDFFFKSNGVSSISFLPHDLLSLEAQLSYRDTSIAGTPVTFDVESPNGTQFLEQTETTDENGTANITLQVPWPSNQTLGIWQASATAEAFEQQLNATAHCECYLAPTTLDVYTQKAGKGPNTQGGNFALNESVTLYAEVRDDYNQTIPDQYISFEIRGPNGTEIALFVQATDSSGIAAETFGIPPYIGTFQVYASTQYNGNVLLDTLTFTTT